MSTESAKDETTGPVNGEAKPEEPPAKKKRGADHQITKDDYDAGGDDNDDGENDDRLKPNSFKRASEEVLAKRKIVKVSRKFGASAPAAPTDASTDKTEKEPAPAASSSNPFASTNLASSTETKKVFGFGSSSGFGAATSGSSNGFGSGSSGFGSGSSGFGGSGGFAGVGSSGKSSGFGSASSSGFVFGSKSSANGGSTSLFGNGGASGITFSLSKNADSEKKDADNFTTIKLPEKVDLKTGEEDEEEIHSGRCKSYEWVEDKSSGGTQGGSADDSGDANSSPTKTNPSVQSSTQFQAAISSGKKDDADEKGAASTEKTSENGNASESNFRWTELGIGPVKILRSKSNPERLRMVQRRESSKNGPGTKVILNIPLWKESTCVRDRGALKYLRLNTMKEGKMCQYSLKFKENSDAGYFHHYLTELIPLARKCFDDSTKAE